MHETGALMYVDGVHYTADSLVDVEQLGADFFTCSPYKFLGPHHGVLAARPELLETLHPDKLFPSTDVVPERFELGTLPYEFLAGTRAAVDFLAGLDARASGTPASATGRGFHGARGTRGRPAGPDRQGTECPRRCHGPLHATDGTAPPAADRRRSQYDGCLSVPLGTRCPRAVRVVLAIEASGRLGLWDTGGLRVGLAPYNNTEDVERLLAGLSDFLAGPS
ncbi:cysteine desulfurase-like protein [Streptomyces hirsutus]